MTQSINRSKEHALTIKILTDKDPNTDKAVFPTIKALQCFAAVVGFADGERKQLTRGNTENIEWHIFENGNLTQYIYLIALAGANEVNILKYDIESQDSRETNNMIQIFEEYANRGFEIITGWLNRTPTDRYGTAALLLGMRRDGFIEKANNQFQPINF